MVLNKLPGIYFTETVESMNVDVVQEKTPLFIIYSEEEIPSLKDKLNKLTLEDFNAITVGEDKKAISTVIPKSYEFINQAMNELTDALTYFYVYEVTSVSDAALKTALVDITLYDDIQDVFFFEETKITEKDGIKTVMTDIKAGVEDNAKHGCERIVYVVPYGTINDAVSNATGTPEDAIISTYQTILADVTSGRISTILPDSWSGVVAGKIIDTDYDEEVGYTTFNTTISALTYDFTYTNFLTLQNLGVLFIRTEILRGVQVYRINLGVTTSISSTKNLADSFLIHRRIADQLLRDLKEICDDYLKGKETASTLAQIQSEINGLIKDYVNDSNVESDGTELTVSESNTTPITWDIVGTIQPTACVGVIEVNTTLQ